MAFATTYRHSSTKEVRGREVDTNFDALGVYVDATFLPIATAATTYLAISAAATQDQQETGTSTVTYVSPGRQHFHASSAKAWVMFDGTGTPAIIVSYGATSITDNGTGDYTVNWSITMSSANYAVAGSAYSATGNGTNCGVSSSSAPTATTTRVQVHTPGVGVTDSSRVSVVLFGDI